MEQWEEARRQEKARHVTNNKNDDNDDDNDNDNDDNIVPIFALIFLLFYCLADCYGLVFFWQENMGVVTSQHKQVPTSQFCIGNMDPSDLNWSDILCWDNMLPTCRQHFQLSLRQNAS
jgi:hypothetical protein